MLLKQEGAPMAGLDLSTRQGDGQVIVVLRGELDMAEAARVAAAFAAVAVGGPQIIVDLAGLEFIDSSGLAALVRGRNLARQAGGELLLAAPQQRVLRVLTLTRLTDVFPVHASMAEAAGSWRVTAEPAPRRASLASWPRAAMRSAAGALAGERRLLRKRAGAAEALPVGRTAVPVPIPDDVRIAWSISVLAGAGTKPPGPVRARVTATTCRQATPRPGGGPGAGPEARPRRRPH